LDDARHPSHGGGSSFTDKKKKAINITPTTTAINDNFTTPTLQQRLSLLQIARVEPFGEPAVERSEKFASLLRLPLIAPQGKDRSTASARQARRIS